MSKQPVIVRVANCKSVSAPTATATAIYRTALTKRGHYGVPHIVLAMECSDFDAELEAEKLAREAIQYGGPGDLALRGSALAFDPAHVRLLTRRPPIETSPAGDGTRSRYTVRARLNANGHREWWNAGHTPPDRSPSEQRQWFARSKHIDGIFGADFNDRPDFLDPRYGRQVCAIRGEVLGLLVPKRIPVSATRPVDIGSDHLGQDTVLWPAKER